MTRLTLAVSSIRQPKLLRGFTLLCLSPVVACAVKRRRFPVGASPTRQPLQPEAALLHRPRRQRPRPRVVSRTVHSPAFRLRRRGWPTCCCGRRGSLQTRRLTRSRRSLQTRRSIHSHSCSGRWVHCRTSRSFPRCRKRPSSGPATVLTGGPEPPPVVGRSTSRLALQPTTPLRVAQQLSPVSSWWDAFTVQAKRYNLVERWRLAKRSEYGRCLFRGRHGRQATHERERLGHRSEIAKLPELLRLDRIG